MLLSFPVTQCDCSEFSWLNCSENLHFELTGKNHSFLQEESKLHSNTNTAYVQSECTVHCHHRSKRVYFCMREHRCK